MAIKTWYKKRLIGQGFGPDGQPAAVLEKQGGGQFTLALRDPSMMAGKNPGLYNMDVDQTEGQPWSLLALNPPSERQGGRGGGGWKPEAPEKTAMTSAVHIIGQALAAEWWSDGREKGDSWDSVLVAYNKAFKSGLKMLQQAPEVSQSVQQAAPIATPALQTALEKHHRATPAPQPSMPPAQPYSAPAQPHGVQGVEEGFSDDIPF